MSLIKNLFLIMFPVVIMVALIPVINNDHLLTAVYSISITLLIMIRKDAKVRFFIFIFGFITMLIFEYIFISTGIETFIRNSLFGIMPLWLPFLWGYGFVAIRDGVGLVEKSI